MHLACLCYLQQILSALLSFKSKYLKWCFGEHTNQKAIRSKWIRDLPIRCAASYNVETILSPSESLHATSKVCWKDGNLWEAWCLLQNRSDRPIRQKRTSLEEAEFWRNKGNDYFKFGDLRKAKECYTTSLQASPSAATYANRALMSVKAKEWSLAEADCTQVQLPLSCFLLMSSCCESAQYCPKQ